jgi:hypothetical protein
VHKEHDTNIQLNGKRPTQANHRIGEQGQPTGVRKALTQTGDSGTSKGKGAND